ncbi:MAG: PQQ-dependent sugar dehydrogenase [Steroidobacteraceae bacterium]|jgi:glucose/arabinose dehydrogenase|nr:PQQ-dependent sugar dehydrogenase [Steroidobacteraceae bacterium]
MKNRLAAGVAALSPFVSISLAVAAPAATAAPAAATATVAPATLVSSGDVPVLTGFRRTTVLEGLEFPWAVAWLPDGTQLITERPGRLRVVRDGKLDPTPVAGLPAVFAEGQGGLLDVMPHPSYAQNRLLYFTYAHGTREANRTRVARATFDGKQLADWQVIYEVPAAKSGGAHFGSRLAWLPDGTLLVSIGDGGNPPIRLGEGFIRDEAQNRGTAFGKILRLNDDGSVPEDNPFAKAEGADPAVWSYGHRNVQGLAVAPDGRVWATEHGPLGGDELNQVNAGANHGWPLVTHGREYTGPAISADRSRSPFVDPRVVWDNATAPSGLAVYAHERIPEWRGNVFSGGLMTQDVRRLVLDAQGRVVEQKALRVGQRVRDVRVGPDGLLYVLTDEKAGRLLRFEPAT